MMSDRGRLSQARGEGRRRERAREIIITVRRIDYERFSKRSRCECRFQPAFAQCIHFLPRKIPYSTLDIM